MKNLVVVLLVLLSSSTLFGAIYHPNRCINNFTPLKTDFYITTNSHIGQAYKKADFKGSFYVWANHNLQRNHDLIFNQFVAVLAGYTKSCLSNLKWDIAFLKRFEALNGAGSVLILNNKKKDKSKIYIRDCVYRL